MAIGDINSNKKGTAARFNDGKPDMSLIPLNIFAEAYNNMFEEGSDAYKALTACYLVGNFQMGGDPTHLNQALFYIGAWEETANVFEYGKKKYAAWNWAKGFDWSVPIACIGRHARYVIQDGELIDQESGFKHIAHIMCNIIMLRYFVEFYPEGDDRIKVVE